MAKKRDNESFTNTGKEIHLGNYYTSIEDLPKYNFDKIDKTADLMWLYENFNGRQPKVNTEDLNSVYQSIYDEYFEALGDKSIATKLQKIARKDNLQLKYNVILGLIKRVSEGFSPDMESQKIRAEFINVLKKWGYTIPIMQSVKKDIIDCERILQSLQSIKIQIALIDTEIKKGSFEGEEVSNEKQLLVVAKGLELGYRINPKEITVKEWIEMLKLLKSRE